MTYEQVKDHFGTAAKVAKALRCDPRNVGNWKSRGVPAAIQKRLERLTKGALQADK